MTLTRHQQNLGKCKPTNIRQVNAFIRSIKDTDPGLRNGGGYFYFTTLLGYYETSVYVNSVDQMTYLEWLSEYESLKGQGQ